MNREVVDKSLHGYYLKTVGVIFVDYIFCISINLFFWVSCVRKYFNKIFILGLYEALKELEKDTTDVIKSYQQKKNRSILWV